LRRQVKAIARHVIDSLYEMRLVDNMVFVSEEASKYGDPYKVLIATILSQNTNDKNSMRAFAQLDREIGVDIDSIMSASKEDIINAIRIGGIYNIKAHKIKEVSRTIMDRYDGDLYKIVESDDPRSELLRLPGVGFKTADIMLLFFGIPSFPVDTHISRITKRLGFLGRGAGYEDIRGFWMEVLEKDEYRKAHLTLISFGRRICRAKNPLCNICTVKDSCRYYREYGSKEV
jgi:endonuclease-3